MGYRPKPLFWFVVVLLIIGFGAFSFYRASTTGKGVVSKVIGTTGGEMEILFYTSSAKKSWINKMVEQFNSEQRRVGGAVVKIKAFHVNSGESLEDMKSGRIKPDIWSPGDESWFELARLHWKNVHQKEIFDQYQPLVNIPLVIAMWEPMARALGYPQKPIGWQDIEKVAANPKGWAAYGHPEWGKFRWGHAHPDANSGFLSIVSEVYAVLGKTSGITPQDLKNPKVVNFLRDFEGAVEHYGLSNSWIDETMRTKGPSYLSCAVQYENTIIESNEKYQNKPFKMVAVYPREGFTWTQHPIAVINGEWMTPERREASKMFMDYLLSREAQTTAMQMGLRPIAKDIQLGAPFDEAHGVMLKVDASRKFTVPDEAVLKRIIDLWEEAKLPATIIMVIDRSGSMKGDPMDGARAGSVEFVKNMKPRDKLKVIIFNNEITTLSELCPVRECGEQAISKLQGVFAEGGTALYDATAQAYAYLKELKKAEPNRRYGVLVLSDGKDTSSKTNKNDFLDMLPQGEDFDVPKIYTIAYGSEADKPLLTEIANRTNAKLFTSKAEEITKTYKELSANF